MTYIHLIYIPWKSYSEYYQMKEPNAIQCLEENKTNFDTSYYYHLKNMVPKHIHVLLWTFDSLKCFSDKKNPQLWDMLWNQVHHPVMIVDFYRWFVVYHLGGFYLQYGSKLLFDIRYIESILFTMKSNTNIKLFVETNITDSESILYGRKYRIRNGIPEENIRVATQSFYTPIRYCPFIKVMLNTILNRIRNYTVQEDYDILYISGNALVSEIYDKYYEKGEIDLISYDERQQLIRYSSKGSWRTDYITKNT